MNLFPTLKKVSVASALCAALSLSIEAQDSSTQQADPQAAQQEQVMKSMQYMLRRAHLTRTLAAEHLKYIKESREEGETKALDNASQVLAFNLICEDEEMDRRTLNQVAADSSLKIAMMAGNSTIAPQLKNIAQKQSVEERMELIGDIATTVLMFEIGRRSGLFDALLTDFGKKRFCSGMQTDMRNRYKMIVDNLGQ